MKRIQAKPARDFNYILTSKDQEKIAFGSSAEREVLPLKQGTSRFACQYMPQLLLNITPTLYNTAEIKSAFSAARTKVVSKKGIGGGAYTAPRFKYITSTTPSPSTYNLRIFPPCVKFNKYPFNSSSSRVLGKTDNNPGVGAYNISASRKRNIKFMYSFGGSKTIDSGANIKCCSQNLDVCSKCGNIPDGDYWQLEMKLFLCRNCKFEEDLDPVIFNKFQLEEFRRIRDCSFMHNHEGTTAATMLMDKYKLHELQNKEAYFSQYFHVRKGRVLNEDPDQVVAWPLKRYEFKRKHHLRSPPASTGRPTSIFNINEF